MQETKEKTKIRKLSKKARQVLDQVCINDDAGHDSRTLTNLVSKGLLRCYNQPFLGGVIFRYEVASVSVHIAWCEVCSEENPDELLE